MQPKVSIIIINYNSMKIIDIVKSSLTAACNLDYPNYEVILVDNGSTDNSKKIIKSLLNKCKIKHKLIELRRNLGFNAANNLAFRARDKDSKYIVLLNNDAVPNKDSLFKLVEYMESHERLAAVQGIITMWNKSIIDNVGFIVDELLYSHALYRGYPPEVVKKSHYCTFVSGAYSLYSVEALRIVNGSEKIFDDIMFAYFDDKILGMKLWAHGYKVKGIPELAARHYGGGTFGKISPIRFYLITRSYIVQEKIFKNHRYKLIATIAFLARQLAYAYLASKTSEATIREYVRAYLSALMIGRGLARRINYSVDITRVPLIKLGLREILARIIAPRQVNKFGRLA